jgi:hypothetical protein
MNTAGTPDNHTPGQAPADSAGRPWPGRELTATGFDGDHGAADGDLASALDDLRDEQALMHAVSRARLLVPVLALPVQAGQLAAGTSAEMAVVTLTAPDGQRAFPVFSSLATLSAWDATARPSPVTSARAAQGAVSEGCDVLLLDCGSAREAVLRPSMVWALAQQRDWLPSHSDPFVAQALVRAVADEPDVIDCVCQDGPAGAGILRVVLGLRAGLDAAGVAALATRVGERIATDGEARARIDGLTFTIRHA